MGGAVLAGALGQWPFGRLSDRMDPRQVIIGAACCAALAVLLFVLWSPSSVTGLLPVVFLFGLFTLPVYSINVAHMNHHVEPGAYGEAARGLLQVFARGRGAAPGRASWRTTEW